MDARTTRPLNALPAGMTGDEGPRRVPARHLYATTGDASQAPVPHVRRWRRVVETPSGLAPEPGYCRDHPCSEADSR